MDGDGGVHGKRRPHAAFPQDPEFYRLVLEHLPTPVVVLDDQARLRYANVAALDLGGWTPQECVGMNTFDQTHPDDQQWVAEVFAEDIVGADESYHHLDGASWGSVEFRMITAGGAVVPIEITGNAGLLDPVVRGIAYDLRPAWASALLGEIVAGIARGDDETGLLALVVEMVALPPLEVDVAIIDASARDSHQVIASSASSLESCLAGRGDPLPWSKPSRLPAKAMAVDFDATSCGAALVDAGYVECWHVAVGGSKEGDYRLIGATPFDRRYENSLRQRLVRGADLAAVVLQRARDDRLLAHAALHDSLTGVANRLAFHTKVSELGVEGGSLGLLYLDVDRFKAINDSMGHAGGDAVLREVSERLGAIIRPTDLVARVGGDEFAIVVAGSVDQTLIITLVHRIEAALARPVVVHGTAVDVSVSVGAVFAGVVDTVERVIRAADAAMYAVKRGSRRSDEVAILGPADTDPADGA